MTNRFDDAVAAVRDALRSESTRAEDALAALVKENSFTENRDGGNRVGALLDALFDGAGLTATVHGSARFADHRVYTTPLRRSTDSCEAHRASAPAVALIGHHDTVFPPGKFEGIRRDGELLRGPGVLDMKGGLVVVASALAAIHATVGLAAIPRVVVVSVGDEEVGSPEGASVLREVLGGGEVSAALVFEAGRAGDAVVTARKGTGGMTIRASGRAAHAGLAWSDGVNAIWALARFVDRAQQLAAPTRGVTVNVGRIEGGIGKNTVPDAATALVDLRFETLADAEQLVTALHAAARAAEEDVPGARISLEGGILRPPMERTDSSLALLRRYAIAARGEGLGGEEAPRAGGGSDACTTSAMGIATLDGLGPRGRGFHTLDEQIEAASLVPKAAALAAFLLAEGPLSR